MVTRRRFLGSRHRIDVDRLGAERSHHVRHLVREADLSLAGKHGAAHIRAQRVDGDDAILVLHRPREGIAPHRARELAQRRRPVLVKGRTRQRLVSGLGAELGQCQCLVLVGRGPAQTHRVVERAGQTRIDAHGHRGPAQEWTEVADRGAERHRLAVNHGRRVEIHRLLVARQRRGKIELLDLGAWLPPGRRQGHGAVGDDELIEGNRLQLFGELFQARLAALLC